MNKSRNRGRVFWKVLAVLLCLTAAPAVAQEAAEDADARIKFLQEAVVAREQALIAIDQVLSAYDDYVLDHRSRGDEADADLFQWKMWACTAIETAGLLRFAELAPALTQYVTLRKPLIEDMDMRRNVTESIYPATAALIDIGLPSVDPCLSAIEKSKDADARKNLLWVLIRLLGRDQAHAIIVGRIDAASKDDPDQTDQQKRKDARYVEHMNRVLSELEQIPEDGPIQSDSKSIFNK